MDKKNKKSRKNEMDNHTQERINGLSDSIETLINGYMDSYIERICPLL